MRRLVVAVAVAAAAGAGAIPAAADAPAITITAPDDGATLSARSEVTATVAHQGPGAPGVQTVTLALTPERAGRPAVTVTGSCESPPPFLDCTDPQRVLVAWTPEPTFNGEYTVSVQATTGTRPVVHPEPGEGRAERTLRVAIPPAPPAGVAATVDGRRITTVTWTASAEPDVIGYEVSRSRDGGPSTRAGEVPANAGPRFVDASTAQAAGAYSYRVRALREGVDTGARVASTDSTPATATVPAATGASRPAPARTGPASPPPTVDRGFAPTLPFDRDADSDTEQSAGAEETEQAQQDTDREPGTEEAQAPSAVIRTEVRHSNRRAVLLYVGAALVVLVLALQVRVLLRRASLPEDGS